MKRLLLLRNVKRRRSYVLVARAELMIAVHSSKTGKVKKKRKESVQTKHYPINLRYLDTSRSVGATTDWLIDAATRAHKGALQQVTSRL